MKLRMLAGLIITGLALLGVAIAATSGGSPQKKQIESIVQEYILANPEVIVQSLERYQQKQMDETKQTFTKIQNSSAKFADRLFHQKDDPSAGNPNGKITIVEFSDYQCPHCVEMAAVLDEVIKNNNNIRVVFKEYPIRGPISELAAKAALAAQAQGKYYEFHDALMQAVKKQMQDAKQPITEADIYQIAQSVGLNVDKLKKDMNDAAVQQKIKNNYQLAKDMELIWTPILFVARSDVSNQSNSNDIVFIPGRVEKAQLTEVVDKFK